MDQRGRPTVEQFHRRMRALRTLATARGPAWDAAVEEALQVFGSEQELLLASYQRWEVHLLARLDAVLELGTGDRHTDVERAVEELGRTMPGLAALLRAHSDDPCVAPAGWRLAEYVGQACQCGRPHQLLPSAAPRRPPSRCALRRARTAAKQWCRRHLTCAGAPEHSRGALRASAGHA